ncbi:MAG: hypothetical protein GX248_06185 [Peptococcaceae bacterium]|jgi:hypothetical protein|nr:hypothetical protein [Peptococcaceae bacterium]
MGTGILKGITTGLLVTVLTLLAVLASSMAGIDKTIIAYLVDFGLLLSCLAAGYRASSYSGRILPGGLAAGGYAVVGILLLALYFSIDIFGALKIVSEGIGLGLLAGVLGAGVLSSERRSYYSYERVEPRATMPYRRREPAVYSREDYEGDVESEILRYKNNSERERAKILELCYNNPEIAEEEEAFDWWKINARRQLKGR